MHNGLEERRLRLTARDDVTGTRGRGTSGYGEEEQANASSLRQLLQGS